MEKIGFGGACHWCTEAIFSSLKGVIKVEQGWISSTLQEASEFSEAVIVYFDKTTIALEVLVEIHLLTHSSTSTHPLRHKYRSAIYTFDNDKLKVIEDILIEKQKLFKKPLITKVYPFKEFKLNSQKFLNYYEKNRGKEFCNRHIEPKLALILKEYANFAK